MGRRVQNIQNKLKKIGTTMLKHYCKTNFKCWDIL